MNITEKVKPQPINIAIDGWSACGKGTLAKDLAKALGYICIDTGAMYRAVTLEALRCKIGPNNPQEILNLLNNTQITIKTDGSLNQNIFINGHDVTQGIRTPEVNNQVSYYSALTSVRQYLVKQQQDIARDGGVVMDGRDIGTVVLPGAELKIFMTATPEIRAARRYKEELSKGNKISLAEISMNLQERDRIDSTRTDSPLKQAPDARVLDNSNLNTEAQLKVALTWAQEAIQKRNT